MSAELEVTTVSKSYGGVPALSDVSVSVASGSVLALLGENGAGKSTLLNIIGGVVSPDTGDVRLAGEPLPQGNALGTLRRGVTTVHQELTLFPDLSVWENIWASHPRQTWNRHLDRQTMKRESVRLLGQLGARIDPSLRVAGLTIAERTQVEIAKALSWDPRLLILDEATSTLGGAEVEALFGLVRELSARGTSVIFVSHRLSEVKQIADSALVLRDGKAAAYFEDVHPLTEDDIVLAMIGRSLAAIFPERATSPAGESRLVGRDLRGGRLKGVTIEARAGEILGLGGLQGHGQQQVLQALFGAVPIASGTVEVDGHPVRHVAPRVMMRHKVAYVPPDRKGEGLLLSHSVEANLTLSSISKVSAKGSGWIDLRKERRVVDRLRQAMRIVQRRWQQPVESLSGGNQQKVLIGRWIETDPDTFLLDEPTRGVDIGTKAEIYRLLRVLADEGKAVVVASTEAIELLGLCDRILVMYDGQVHRELAGGSINEYELTEATLGVARGQESPPHDPLSRNGVSA